MRWPALLWPAVLAVNAGCATTTVNLAVTNPKAETHDVSVRILNRGVEEQHLNLGSVLQDSTVRTVLKVRPSRDVQVMATAQGYSTWKSTPVTVTPKPNPRSIAERVSPQYGLVDDVSSVTTIVDAFSKMGKYYGLPPATASQAIPRYLGALLLIIPPSKDTQDGEELLHIPPTQVIGTPQNGPITYAATNESNSVKITGSAAASVQSAWPMIGLNGTYNRESVYELKWSLNGFGNILVAEPPAWNLTDAIARLPQPIKKALHDLMMEEPRAVLLYITRVYAVRYGALSRREARKLSAGVELTVSSLLTARGAWSFEGVDEQAKSFADAVLNIGGPVIHLSLLKSTRSRPGSGQTEEYSIAAVRETGLELELGPGFKVRKTVTAAEAVPRQ